MTETVSTEAGEAQEGRQEGHVRASVWVAYAGSMGWASTVLIAVSLLLMQVCHASILCGMGPCRAANRFYPSFLGVFLCP